MTEFSLVAAKLPGGEYASSNLAYYKNLSNTDASECYLLFKKSGIIKLAKKLSIRAMKDNYIYLSRQDRLNLKIMPDDLVEVTLTDKPTIASTISISITDKTKINSIEDISDNIINVLKKNIIGTVLSVNSFYTFLFQGVFNAFIISIVDCNNSEINNGFVDDKTELIIVNKNININDKTDNIKNTILPKVNLVASTLIILLTDRKNKEIDFVTPETEVYIKKNIINQIIKVNTNTSYKENQILYYVHFISILNETNTEIDSAYINNNTEIIFANNNNKNLNTLTINLSSINFENIGIGGLEKEFTELVKKLFITRIIPNATYKKLGIKHTKGAILYGPPGCGKTRIARTLGEIINCKNIRVINGPELKDKYVGESERKIRECFDGARNNPTELHLLIFDEFDSIAGTRSSGDPNKHGNSIVGQLLTMLDGFEEMNNLIVFALTNRLDMIDPAILRPGRFGLHIKIDLPNTKGRHEILLIHSKKLASNNLLDTNVDFIEIANATENFTGAELELLVQNTIQHVLGSQIDFNNIVETASKIENITIKQEDFLFNLSQINPMFKNDKQIKNSLENRIKKSLSEENYEIITFILELLENTKYPIIFCIEGPAKSGKTTIVCEIAKQLNFDNIEYIGASTLCELTDQSKIDFLKNIFSKQIQCLIILDNIETIIEFISENIFNRQIVNFIKVLLSETKHNVIITTSYHDKLSRMTILDSVDFVKTIIA